MTIAIRPCNCVHHVQDKLYGVGMRLHNFANNHPDKSSGGWRCTVCGFDTYSKTTGAKIKGLAKPA